MELDARRPAATQAYGAAFPKHKNYRHTWSSLPQTQELQTHTEQPSPNRRTKDTYGAAFTKQKNYRHIWSSLHQTDDIVTYGVASTTQKTGNSLHHTQDIHAGFRDILTDASTCTHAHTHTHKLTHGPNTSILCINNKRRTH